ncbi:hypothetical protein RHGRI_019256 [Rhododendron griersonianum]|uniref:Scarecrow-like protein 6 n=1 Tax=Rhododendron griersonianum TaxID=479676 RepID=A0AAV6JBU7_9ERIC|nr:hypothetical protein RHGRI_019256 [Rhododendron griersonianum]
MWVCESLLDEGMPLPFDFEGKGVLLDLVPEDSSCFSSNQSSNPLLYQWKENKQVNSFLGFEPTSVLDTIGSPSPPTSTSTLVGSGSGGSTDTAGVAAVSGNSSQKWQETTSSNAGIELGSGGGGPGLEKCGLVVGMEDWESMLSDSVEASPGQEQSVYRWIMGDVEDPSMGLNKLLQSGGGVVPPASAEFDFNSGGFGVVDQGFGLDPSGNFGHINNPSLPFSTFPHSKLGLAPNPPNFKLSNPSNPNNFPPFSNTLGPISNPFNPLDCPDLKPQIFNPNLLINHPTQNPAFFLPFPYTQNEHSFPPQAKRHNPGGGGLDLVPQSQDLSLQFLHQRNITKTVADEMGQHQQGIMDQLFKAAELIQIGNTVLAQGILARLNHHLSPIGKPFVRASFFCKESLLQLLNMAPNLLNPSPINLIMKIGAYKSFSEISPLLQFANFTCNQALLEALDGSDQIHVIDFDIGFGGQWASLMQELAMRGGGPPSLKITAFASPSTHDQLELGLTRENLNHFACEINIPFEFEILSLDSLHSASWSQFPLHLSENEAIAVNLPIASFSNSQLSLPLILRFIKQLSPKIVVSLDRGCDRTDLPFPNHVIHALQSYSNLLESLDAVNVNLEALQKIERFLLQPSVEKIVMGRYRSPEKTAHWRTLFLSSGFSPLTFSNFAESQADCLVKKTPVRGFHVEKRQSSLVLCWQRKELISASAWRC